MGRGRRSADREYVEGPWRHWRATLPGERSESRSASPGTGSNLRALAAAADRASSVGPSPWCSPTVSARRSRGRRAGDRDRTDPGGDDATLALTLEAVAPRCVVLAGTCASWGPASCGRSRGGSSTPIPSLLPAVPGAHAVGGRTGHGVAVPAARSTSSMRCSTVVRSSPRGRDRPGRTTTSPAFT